jgi:hypothetical protein
MLPPHPESLYYPYTKKALTVVRCVFGIISGGLIAVSFWHAAVIIGVIFFCLIWLIYEIVFHSHRRRLEAILNHGEKLTGKIVDKTNDFRRRLCFFLVQYEYQHEHLEATVCVPDALYHRREIEDLVKIIVSPSHPKQCIVIE